MTFPPPSQKQARLMWMALTALSLGVLLALIGMLLWGLAWLLNVLSPVLWPLAIGGILAYLLDPVVDFFERRKMPRRRAVLLVFFMGMLATAAFLGSVVPGLVSETGRLISAVPQYSQTLQQDLNRWMSGSPFLDQWGKKFFPNFRVKNVPATVSNSAAPPAPVTAPPSEKVAPSKPQPSTPPAEPPDWAGKVPPNEFLSGSARRCPRSVGGCWPNSAGWPRLPAPS